MKKQNVLNLIKYHMEKNETAFRNEAISIARYFDSIGDDQLAEYIMGLIAESNLYTPQSSEFESEFLKQVETRHMEPLSKLGQTNKNIAAVFSEITAIPHANKVVVLFDEIDVIALDRINSNDVREMGRVTSTILRELDRLTDLNKKIIIIATTNLFANFDKALTRRFDAVISFNRYSKEDLIEVAEYYFSSYIRNFKGASKDTRLVRKILNTAEKLPYPGELKNIIKTSLAFSDASYEHDYLRRLYSNLIGNIEQTDINELYSKKFTVREIEKLKGESKSTVSRKLSKGKAGVLL